MLREKFLEPLGLTQAAFAQKMGWSEARLNEVIRGKPGMTVEADLDLEDVLGTPPKHLPHTTCHSLGRCSSWGGERNETCKRN